MAKISVNTIVAGFVAVLVGYTSSVAIIIQAANAVGATSPELTSWLWALGIGMGVSCIGLSLYYKQPLLTAWSTPGAALLISALQGYTMSEAIGAFIVSAILIILISASGSISKIMTVLPKEICAAMLAGILLNFGIEAFAMLAVDLVIAFPMVLAYLVFTVYAPKYAIPITLIVGVAVLLNTNALSFENVSVQIAKPVLFTPEFSWQAIISISFPLCLVTMTSQNLPGIAMIKQFGYKLNTNQVLSVTGLTNLLLAPFGAFAFNLAAITAAICMDENINKEKSQRYWAAVFAGVFYLCVGLGALTVVEFFDALPTTFISVLAGLALLNVIKGSLVTSLADKKHRDAALVTLFITASGISFYGISAPVWGILAGVACWGLTIRPQQAVQP